MLFGWPPCGQRYKVTTFFLPLQICPFLPLLKSVNHRAKSSFACFLCAVNMQWRTIIAVNFHLSAHSGCKYYSYSVLDLSDSVIHWYSASLQYGPFGVAKRPVLQRQMICIVLLSRFFGFSFMFRLLSYSVKDGVVLSVCVGRNRRLYILYITSVHLNPLTFA